MTIIEVVVSLSIVTVGAMMALSCLVTTWATDGELRERAVALRAARSAIERVVAFDYDDDIQNLVAFYADPANNLFVIEDLVPAGIPDEGPAVGQGTITVDGTDPDRIVVTVAITWEGRRGPRRLALPLTLTEVIP
ncbi:MAG: hypothetical protein CMJ83_16920 [Planctomycetes bacterium]|nr:hypothetical protein [Planctomycetota bacterium]